MAIFKCKMCGGDLEVNEKMTVGTCEYCGSTMTIPKLDDDRRINLYDRANHFRRNFEFDKAMAIYYSILNEDKTDGEAYWSLVLCKYGIEYVEDPKTHQRIPTCHRTQYTSIFSDEDYKAALSYADVGAKAIYEKEAAAIDAIQKSILEISAKEEPIDVFICYKEVDNNGRRTPDSVLAQDLYFQLKHDGLRVFFARVSLEDKLGSAYEPYIFAALNSAPVMVVLGTKPEHFNAIWVKNEWSRYLSLIKGGAKKTLIPAYKDMDPYNLPEEFSHLQALDMSKLGFMQDLLRGIKKIVEGANIGGGHSSASNSTTSSLLKRALLFIEDGDYKSAEDYCERVLDINPEDAHAYTLKLMIELKVHPEAKLSENDQPLTVYSNFQKAIRFADSGYKAILLGYNQTILDRHDNSRKETIYSNACKNLSDDGDEKYYRELANIFRSINDYKDAALLATKCDKLAEQAFITAEEFRKEKIYIDAIRQKMDGMNDVYGYYSIDLSKVAKLFRSIPGYKDSDLLAEECENLSRKKKAEQEAILIQQEEDNRIREEQARLESARKTELQRIENEKRKKRNLKYTMIFAPIGAILIVFLIVFNLVIIPNRKYQEAKKLMASGNYDQAQQAFDALGDFSDSSENAKEAKYQIAKNLFENNKFTDAIIILQKLGEYQDARQMLDTIYDHSMELLESKQYGEAIHLFKTLGDFENSSELLTKTKYEQATEFLNNNQFTEAIDIFQELGNYEKSFELLSNAKYKQAKSLFSNKQYSEAALLFGELDDYKDSKTLLTKSHILSNAKVGSKLFFGNYEQDNNSSNGKEKIAWIVLEVVNRKALLVSEKILDRKPFNITSNDVKWETCSLRYWLNSNFYNESFNIDEQTLIDLTSNANEDNPIYGTPGGNSTQDKVFLLSINEVEKYLHGNNLAYNTAFSFSLIQNKFEKEGNPTPWFLRSPGENPTDTPIGTDYLVSFIDENGNIDISGANVSWTGAGVRPALWLNLPS